MKKLIVGIATFAILGNLAFAQVKVHASNEIYSESVYKTADGNNDEKSVHRASGKGFWGLQNTAYGKVETNRFDIEARYRIWLWNFGSTDLANSGTAIPNGENYQSVNWYNWVNLWINTVYRNGTEVTDDEGNVSTILLPYQDLQANFWWRPVRGLEIALGNDYMYSVPAGYMMATDSDMGWWINSFGYLDSMDIYKKADDPIGNNNAEMSAYAKNGLSLNVTAVKNLTFGFNLPETNLLYIIKGANTTRYTGATDEGRLGSKWNTQFAVNAGINWHIGDEEAEKTGDIGITYHGGRQPEFGHIFGVYGQYVGKKVRFPIGFTFSLPRDDFKYWNNLDYGAIRMDLSIAPDFRFDNGAIFAFALDAAAVIPPNNTAGTNGATIPLLAYFYVQASISPRWTMNIRTGAEYVIGNGLQHKSVATIVTSADRDTPTREIVTFDNPGQFYLEPKFVFNATEHHEFGIGAKVRLNFSTGDNATTYLGYSVPIWWKYTW